MNIKETGKLLGNREKTKIALATALYLLASLCLLAYPILAKETALILSDEAKAEFTAQLWLIFKWAVLVIIQSSSGYLAMVLVGTLTETKIAELREKIFQALAHADNHRISALTPGDQLARLINDTYILGHFVSHTIPNLLPQLIACLGAFILLIHLELKVAILLSIALVPTAIIAIVLGKMSRRFSQHLMEANSALFSYADECIKTFLITKAFSAEPFVQTGFAGKNRQFADVSIRHLIIQQAYMPLTRAVGVVLFVVFIVTGWSSLDGADWEASDIATVLFYCLLVVRPASGATQVYGRYQYAKAAWSRLKPLTENVESGSETQPGLAETSHARKPDAQSVKIERLAFKYPDQDILLKDINLTLQKGKIILIRGANGAGKSTLLLLLLRILEPISGSIHVDGIGVEKIQKKQWRRYFGYVSQEPMLRAGTIRENIELGRVVDSDHMAAVLQIAGLDDVISEKREGLRHILSSGGSGLSGGQSQRCAVARALLGNPSFLLFDEPTSMQDMIGLRHFLESRDQWANTSGVLVISHDAALAAMADTVYELTNGELVLFG